MKRTVIFFTTQQSEQLLVVI